MVLVDRLEDEPVCAVVHRAAPTDERAAVHFGSVVQVNNGARERRLDLLASSLRERLTGASEKCGPDMQSARGLFLG